MALGTLCLFLLQASKYSIAAVHHLSPVHSPDGAHNVIIHSPFPHNTKMKSNIDFPYKISKDCSGICGQESDDLVISLCILNSIKYYQTAMYLKKLV